MKRYKVATCTGYPFTFSEQGSGSKVGLTASVLDTLNAHREVKRFRSEERERRFPFRFRSLEATTLLAQEYADKLNAECGHT